MEKENVLEERVGLETLMQLEELLEKKTKIYSRLLLSPALAKKMEELSILHGQRREELYLLSTGKSSKKKMGEGE
ncbi:MAG: hypothetical protein IKZ28_00675 [Clostridia bacterium]|nr:hypothetical protein [Clostridia bacterium]